MTSAAHAASMGDVGQLLAHITHRIEYPARWPWSAPVLGSVDWYALPDGSATRSKDRALESWDVSNRRSHVQGTR